MLLNLGLFPRLRRLNPPACVEEGSGNRRDSETSGFLENINEVERGGRGGTGGALPVGFPGLVFSRKFWCSALLPSPGSTPRF